MRSLLQEEGAIVGLKINLGRFPGEFAVNLFGPAKKEKWGYGRCVMALCPFNNWGEQITTRALRGDLKIGVSTIAWGWNPGL